jgi:hypothetical protein
VTKTSAGEAALLDDLVGDFGVAALADRHLDTGFLGEAVGPGLGQTLMLGVVHDEAVGGPDRGAGAGHGGEQSGSDEGGFVQCHCYGSRRGVEGERPNSIGVKQGWGIYSFNANH